jgi:hypothetical protein
MRTGLPEATVEIVASIAQHRTLTTAQAHTIHFPGRSRRWTQYALSRLEGAGLIAFARMPASTARLWFVTEAGAELAQDAGVLREPPKVLTPKQAAGQLHAHTLAVTDTAITFLRAARARADEFGPLSWRHEVSHPLSIGRGRRRRRTVADAVFTYVLTEAGGGGELSVAHRFIELDRATLAVDQLAAELARYADLYRADGRGKPLWRDWYPVFPPVLCVLAGDVSREALERRRVTAMALLRNDPRLEGLADVGISICLLADLQERGPFAPVFAELQPGELVNWLGSTGESE